MSRTKNIFSDFCIFFLLFSFSGLYYKLRYQILGAAAKNYKVDFESVSNIALAAPFIFVPFLV